MIQISGCPADRKSLQKYEITKENYLALLLSVADEHTLERTLNFFNNREYPIQFILPYPNKFLLCTFTGEWILISGDEPLDAMRRRLGIRFSNILLWCPLPTIHSRFHPVSTSSMSPYYSDLYEEIKIGSVSADESEKLREIYNSSTRKIKNAFRPRLQDRSSTRYSPRRIRSKGV